MKPKVILLISVCISFIIGLIIVPNDSTSNYLALNDGVSEHLIKFEQSGPTLDTKNSNYRPKLSRNSFIYPVYKADSGIDKVYACISSSGTPQPENCKTYSISGDINYYTNSNYSTYLYCGTYYLYTYAISKAGNRSEVQKVASFSETCYYDEDYWSETPSKPSTSCDCNCKYTTACFEAEVDALGQR